MVFILYLTDYDSVQNNQLKCCAKNAKKVAVMKKLLFISGLALVGLVGCMSARDKITEEYNRIVSLPPAVPVVCGCDRAIDDLGAAVCDIRNFAQGKLALYVKATENHRDYVGFMNDVALLVKEEGMSTEDAVQKQKADILKEDAARPEAEKVWPRVVEGVVAMEALKPEMVLKEIAVMVAKNANLIASASNLSNSFKGFDATTLTKLRAVKDISAQATEAAECLAFLTEQFRKVQVAKLYTK